MRHPFSFLDLALPRPIERLKGSLTRSISVCYNLKQESRDAPCVLLPPHDGLPGDRALSRRRCISVSTVTQDHPAEQLA